MTLRNRDGGLRDPDDDAEEFDAEELDAEELDSVEAADDIGADPMLIDGALIDGAMVPVEINPVYLARGRGNKGGNTKALAVRLPSEIRREMKARVEAGEFGSEGELVRFALIEYFANRPRSGI
ncbi:MAG: hypothetical protein U0R81_06185 [Mycobacterium sp.]